MNVWSYMNDAGGEEPQCAACLRILIIDKTGPNTNVS